MIKAIAAAFVAAAVFPLLIILLVTAGPAPVAAKAPAPTGLAGAATAVARAGIPPDYLIWYMDAAQTCPGLPWSVLAGIGTVESGNGQSDLPGVHSGANFAGAEGPMQFLPATFAEYATGPDKPLSPYDPADAIYSAAAMLCASGARGGTGTGIENAVFAYNHAGWYVSEVMSWAGNTPPRAAPTSSPPPSRSRKPRSASPTSSAPPALTRMTAPAWSTPPTPRPASTSPAPPTSGSKTARLSRCPRSSPATCCSPPAPTALPSNPGHVVMYLGGGQVIQAPQTGEDVQIDPADLASVVVATRPADLATTP